MSLLIEKLELHNFRNFDHQTVRFDKNLTVLMGRNAAGKTNTVEALQFLTTGYSFRKPTSLELLGPFSDKTKIKLFIHGDKRYLEHELLIEDQKKKFKKNGKKSSSSEILGTMLSILFCPDDLFFIKGSPTKRRSDLDMFGIQIARGFYELNKNYSKTLEQRNSLLKDRYTPYELEAWNILLAQYGAQVLQARLRLYKRLRKHVAYYYQEIAQTESLEVGYRSSIIHRNINKDENLIKNREFIIEDIPSVEDLCNQFLESLEEKKFEEIRRGQTLVGPHRDDLVFYIDDKNAHIFASQGQQRSIVLAWKMAQVKVVEEILDQKPLLLLDDVMSELDIVRRGELSRLVMSDIQSVITTTNLDYFPQELLSEAKVVKIDG